MMMIIAEFFVVILKVLWSFVTAGARWVVQPKEKSVAGQVCVITGAGSGLGRLFAKEFARRRAVLVLWDINSQSNEETAEMVREIYRETETPAATDGKSAWRTLDLTLSRKKTHSNLLCLKAQSMKIIIILLYYLICAAALSRVELIEQIDRNQPIFQ